MMTFQLGDFYLILKILGLFTFVVMGGYSCTKAGLPLKKALSLTGWAAILAFGGGRFWFVIQHFLGREPYDLREWYRVWDNPGTVLYGWILFGTCAVFLFCRSWKLSFLKIFDALVPWILVGQILNRFGCYAAGCCFGRPLRTFWAIYNPYVGQWLHPVQLYEAAFDLALIAIIQTQKKSFDGKKTLIYFIGYSVGRFVLEFFRGDNLPVLFGLTVPQLTSVFILLAVFFIWLAQPEPGE